jgi:HJR/Mrr/RecB family endonuclease
MSEDVGKDMIFKRRKKADDTEVKDEPENKGIVHSGGAEGQPSILPVASLQVAKQVTQFGTVFHIDRESVQRVQFLLPYIKADLEALEGLVPRERMSRKQWIEFLKNEYPKIYELLRDGLSATDLAFHLEYFCRHSSDVRLKGVLSLGLFVLEEYKKLTRGIGAIESRLLEEARLTLESAIAQGLCIFDEAEAYYWIAFTLHFYRYIAFFTNDYARRSPEKKAEAPLKLAVKVLQKHLRQSPQDLEARKLLVSSYRILGYTDALYKAEIELKKVETASQFSAEPGLASEGDRSGITFELKCQRLLEAKGFATIMTSVTSDGGIDIMASSTDPLLSGTYVVQCKDWQGGVGVKPVRELYGVVVSEDANKGILITSSYFTKSAVEFAQGKRLELIDGEQLDRLIGHSSDNL